jgi:hemerythrin
MINPREGGAQTEVGPHNTFIMATEDLPEEERKALK